MPLTKEKQYKRSNMILVPIVVFVLIGLYFYFFIADTAWLGRLTGEGGDELAWSGRTVQWLAGLAVFVANFFLLVKVPKRPQILITIFELLCLLALFMTTFDLSFAFIASKIGFLIARGAVTTIYVTAISITIAFVIALATAVARLSNHGFAVGVATFYVSLFRGVPLLLQIFVIYMGLPQLGIIIPPIPAGVLALSLCYGAYMSEVFRAGIQSIPKGQWEASEALGLHRRKIMRHVVLPQALKIIIPPTGNSFISMLKDSSLVSVVGIWELTYLSSTLGNREFRNMEMLVTAAAVYWVISMCLEMVQSRIEKRLDVGRTR